MNQNYQQPNYVPIQPMPSMQPIPPRNNLKIILIFVFSMVVLVGLSVVGYHFHNQKNQTQPKTEQRQTKKPKKHDEESDETDESDESDQKTTKKTTNTKKQEKSDESDQKTTKKTNKTDKEIRDLNVEVDGIIGDEKNLPKAKITSLKGVQQAVEALQELEEITTSQTRQVNALLTKIESQIKNLEEQLKPLKTQQQDKETDLTDLIDQRNKSSEHATDLKQQINEKEQALIDLQKQENADPKGEKVLTEELKNLKAELNKTEMEISNLDAQIEEAEKNLKAFKNFDRIIRKHIATLEKIAESLTDSIEQTNNLIPGYKEFVTETNNLKTMLESRKKEIPEEIKFYEGLKANLKQALLNYQKQQKADNARAPSDWLGGFRQIWLFGNNHLNKNHKHRMAIYEKTINPTLVKLNIKPPTTLAKKDYYSILFNSDGSPQELTQETFDKMWNDVVEDIKALKDEAKQLEDKIMPMTLDKITLESAKKQEEMQTMIAKNSEKTSAQHKRYMELTEEFWKILEEHGTLKDKVKAFNRLKLEAKTRKQECKAISKTRKSYVKTKDVPKYKNANFATKKQMLATTLYEILEQHEIDKVKEEEQLEEDEEKYLIDYEEKIRKQENN